MKKFSLIFLSIFAAALLSANAFAGDAAAGKKKAGTCAACHGAKGISSIPNYPNLACQKEKYLVKAINDYKTDKRSEPLMKPMVASLSKADVENVAAYYASLGCK